MKYRQIGLGTKIEIELYDKNGHKPSTVLVSQYESYDEDSNMMGIHTPFSQGKIYPVHPGAQVSIIFSKENETYMFKAEVIYRESVEPIPMLWIKPLGPIEKIERRSFFRMDCRLPVQYRVLDSAELDDSEQSSFGKSYTRDISGGGVRIITKEAYKAGTNIEAYIEIDRIICFSGTVVRSIQVRKRGEIMYETGIEFNRIENRDREKIISYVFETQRERLKRGWMKT